MDEKKSIFSMICQYTLETFALSVIAVSISGWLTGDLVSVNEGLLRLGSEGLSFQSIAQLFAYSFTISIQIILLTTDILFKQAMLLWRVVLLLFLGTATSVAFAIIFRWIPLDLWEAWVGFLAFFIAGFGGGLVFMIVKTKIKDKHYEKLLSDYKSTKKD